MKPIASRRWCHGRRRPELIDGDPLPRRCSTTPTAASPSTPVRTSCTSTPSQATGTPRRSSSRCRGAGPHAALARVPDALGSAARISGERVADLSDMVHADLRGTTTCAHLNDVLRSLAGVRTRWSGGRDSGHDLRPRGQGGPRHRCVAQCGRGDRGGVGRGGRRGQVRRPVDVGRAAADAGHARRHRCRIEAAGGDGLAVPTNLAKPHEVEAMVSTTVEHFGGSTSSSTTPP